MMKNYENSSMSSLATTAAPYLPPPHLSRIHNGALLTAVPHPSAGKRYAKHIPQLQKVGDLDKLIKVKA